jgi:hypothetical protein
MVLLSIWRKDKTYFWYTIGAGLVPALSSWWMSYSRYVVMCFPMCVVLAEFFDQRGRARWKWIFLACMAALQCLFIVRYVNFMWAI